MGDIFPTWDSIDYGYLVQKARLVAFDLDGTLARSKMPMKPPVARLFSDLTHLCPVAVISGGKWGLIDSQVLSMVSGTARLSNLHLMPTTGTRYYTWNGEGWECRYEITIDGDLKQKVMESLESRAQQLGLWYDDSRVRSDRIEDRGSQITFSALGQQAPVDEKEKWDPDGSRREALAKAVASDLPELTVRAGGSTSIDVSVKGIDKAYAVRKLAEAMECDIPDIVFVGDRMSPEGNDYPAAAAGTYAVKVTGPEDTEKFISRFIDARRKLGTVSTMHA